jgi:hypothetical protein
MHREPHTATGPFILNVAVAKWSVDEETAEQSSSNGPRGRMGFPVGLAA